MEEPSKYRDEAETIVEEEVREADQPQHDVSLVTEVKEKPYHPIFPGMDVEKPEASQISLSTYWLLGILFVIFFVIKKFIYIPDGERDGK